MGIIGDFSISFSEIYNSVESSWHPGLFSIVKVLLFAILISLVAIFIWKFYRSLSQKNLISLNLNQYNRTEHPLGNKLLATFLFFLEYIIIMPFLIIIWFSALSIIILLVETDQTAAQILFLSAAIVASIRILAYYQEEIAKDLAKLFPFITLSVFLLSPGAFNLPLILNKLSEIPLLIINAAYFLIVILAIEIILRTLFTFIDFLKSEGRV